MGQAKLKKKTAAIELSHLLIAPNYSSLTPYLDSSKGDYTQNIWNPQENFLFLVLLLTLTVSVIIMTCLIGFGMKGE